MKFNKSFFGYNIREVDCKLNALEEKLHVLEGDLSALKSKHERTISNKKLS